MDTNEHELGKSVGLLLKAEVFQIVGCAMEVLNTLGHGLREKTYERSLAVEFRLKGIAFDQQRAFPVTYKGERVDEYVPDLIAFSQVIVDTKTVEAIGDFERGQMLNYLRITGLRVGLILNFKHPKLQWERLVL
jgi:GxxExxY protein